MKFDSYPSNLNYLSGKDAYSNQSSISNQTNSLKTKSVSGKWMSWEHGTARRQTFNLVAYTAWQDIAEFKCLVWKCYFKCYCKNTKYIKPLYKG